MGLKTNTTNQTVVGVHVARPLWGTNFTELNFSTSRQDTVSTISSPEYVAQC